jgi:hypothetical protein
VALWGVSRHAEGIRPWLEATPGQAPSIGGFLFATLASMSLGMIISAVRWAFVDTLLARLGVRPPRWDFRQFAERIPAYEFLIAHHYRYYQFYANMLVALAFSYGCRFLTLASWTREESWLALGLVVTEAILLAGSRDALGKYYERSGALLSAPRKRRRRRCKEPSNDISASKSQVIHADPPPAVVPGGIVEAIDPPRGQEDTLSGTRNPLSRP